MPLARVTLPAGRSRANELYDWLSDAIVSGELQPRERLVETTIAELANVSRTPVRQALQRLEIDGLARDGESGLEVVGFSVDELSDLCAVREALEALATRLAASAGSEVEFALLCQLVDEEEFLNRGDDERVTLARVELNHAFHETLWRAGRNRYLTDELRRLRNLIERLQDTTLREPERREQALQEHRAIVEALVNRDGELAEQLVCQHLRNAVALRLAMTPTVSRSSATTR